MSLKLPLMAARVPLTAWTNGRTSATALKVPPIKFKSNQVPLSQAVKFVKSAPQIPPTCLSVKTVPTNKPIAMKKKAVGSKTRSAMNTLPLMGKPRKKAAIKQMALCIMAIGIRGNVYPNMKSEAFRGEAKSLDKKDVLLSFAIKVPENRAIKDKPKTAIPGANCEISNKLTGILLCIADNKSKSIKGKPNPKPKLIGSLIISLLFLEAKTSNFMIAPPVLLIV